MPAGESRGGRNKKRRLLMANEISLPDPKRFNLASFAELLAARDPIPGEDPGSFDGFHEGLMRSLSPATPYECVIAENLVVIEWELFQQRRMRDNCLRKVVRGAIKHAVRAQHLNAHDAALDAEWERYVAGGGDEDAWEEPFEFDEAAAEEAGDELATRAVSRDRSIQEAAYAEITELGLEPIELLGEAYRKYNGSHRTHDEKIQELERRRREVKRDYDALQKARPIEGEVIEG
ncbi:hypothetical protein [Ovoidimarina sediminis]|uniref:hypothetical protein n=1 Tax=Ovoidimarina sediminis TaxID=3079856 RepID=UPI0029154683|nr:hypothetical protein [Rhodophyticola sp. MJ-SS7]MDU8943251.1 hypothetical protein [Rhodophyticola sp. MJ-SS7]